VFDLAADPLERADLAPLASDSSESLMDWLRLVYRGLNEADASPPQPLDRESAEQLRSLGYAD
jgi:hypothetical protein